MEFLRQHPINFTPFFGTPMSNGSFASCCGAVELVVGLSVIFGLFPRAVLVIAWLPFNLTLTVFSWMELVGHLPYYGVIAALLVWTPSAEDRELWIRGISGLRSRARRAALSTEASRPEEVSHIVSRKDL
jgi:uncharacterized membrane protein YphA (DoxX/SURF4 family)